MTVYEVRGSGEEPGDGVELVGVEILQQDGYIFSQWRDDVLDGRRLQREPEYLLTPVVRVWIAT